MKKKIILIVVGSLFAIVALLAVLFYLKGPFIGFPGSRTADGIVKLRQISTIFWRARPTPGLQINRLAVVLGGETANRFPKLTVPKKVMIGLE